MLPPPLPLAPGDQLLHHGTRADFIVRPVTTASGKVHTREVVLHPGAVIILPVIDDDHIVMIRNQRHTVFEELLELPAGTLERDARGNPENPALCAARELTEETGYTARTITPFGWFYTSPGILTEKMFLFAAYDLEKTRQSLEADEDIEVRFHQWEEVLQMIQFGQIQDAKTVAAVLMYDRFVRGAEQVT